MSKYYVGPSDVKNCHGIYGDQSIVEFNPPSRLNDFESKIDKGFASGFGLRDPDRYARKFMSNANVAPEKGNNVTKFTVGLSDGNNGVRNRVIANASHGAARGLPWPEGRVALNSRLKQEKPSRANQAA